MLRKSAVLALAVGMSAGLALPAPASAEWKHHSTPIQTDTTIGLTGNVRKQGGLGGYECQVTMRVKFLASQTTGIAETYVPDPVPQQVGGPAGTDTNRCKGLGGLAFCQLHNLTPQAPNWTFHTVQAPTSISLTTQNTTATATGGFCPVTHILTTPATITLTPNQPNTFSSMTLSGTLQAHLQTHSQVDTENVTVSGTLNVESPNANTYSL